MGCRRRSQRAVSAPRPAPLPPATARPPSLQHPARARGPPGEARAPPALPALRPRGPHSLAAPAAAPSTCVRIALEPASLAGSLRPTHRLPALEQFENGAERRSQSARRRRRGYPGNGSRDRFAARDGGAPDRSTPGGDGGAGPRCPETERPREARGDGAPVWPENPTLSGGRGWSPLVGWVRWPLGAGLKRCPSPGPGSG